MALGLFVGLQYGIAQFIVVLLEVVNIVNSLWKKAGLLKAVQAFLTSVWSAMIGFLIGLVSGAILFFAVEWLFGAGLRHTTTWEGWLPPAPCSARPWPFSSSSRAHCWRSACGATAGVHAGMVGEPVGLGPALRDGLGFRVLGVTLFGRFKRSTGWAITPVTPSQARSP